jgi:hypothetical protein
MKSNGAVKAQPKVFLTFAAADRVFAGDVADSLRLLGAKVSSFASVASGDTYTDAIRRAIQRSNAVVIPLGQVSRRGELPANVLFEIGAAIGAGREIYVVSRDVAARLPFEVPRLHVLPLSRIDEIIRELETEDVK